MLSFFYAAKSDADKKLLLRDYINWLYDKFIEKLNLLEEEYNIIENSLYFIYGRELFDTTYSWTNMKEQLKENLIWLVDKSNNETSAKVVKLIDQALNAIDNNKTPEMPSSIALKPN